jgi:hypothetical protein
MDCVPAEREGTRVRAFLAQLAVLCAIQPYQDYDVGRQAIEEFAVALDAADDSYSWDAHQCVSVMYFLGISDARAGKCPMCEAGDVRVSAACGMQTVFQFIGEQFEHLTGVKPSHRADVAAEVAHG